MASSNPSNFSLLRLAYRGRSMRGVFKDGDCLWVAAIAFAALQRGDVVAFNSGGKMIVHRIVGRRAGGFITQGDASQRRDRECLAPECLIGRVAERERAGKRSPVMGGIRGRLQGGILRTIYKARRLAAMALAAPYRLIRASGLTPLLWRPRITAVRFSEGRRDFTKFIHRGKTVACWFPHERRWTCRKPYDLILAPPNQ